MQPTFEEFVIADSDRLLRVAMALTGDWPAAEDLVQSALASVWERWERHGPPSYPSAYTNKVLLHKFLSARRRLWRDETPTADLPDSLLYPPTAAIDAKVTLLAALQSLPRRQRAAVVLRFYVDLSEHDTASVMGCSTGAVKSHTSKALARLRQIPRLTGLMTEGAER